MLRSHSLVVSFLSVILAIEGIASLPGPVRIPLTSMGVTGYDAFKDSKSYWDVGVEAVGPEDDFSCEILMPSSNTRAAAQPWAPFDFYSNIVTKEEQADEIKKGTVGEPDIFFSGDDDNRNAAKVSHKWTRAVATNFRGSLEFFEPKRDKKWFSFLIKFTRGKIVFDGLISVRAWRDGDQCKASTFYCTKKAVGAGGVVRCAPDGWNRHLLRVDAEADVSGALSDRLLGITNEKEKNDVAALYGVFQELDSHGQPVGNPYRERIASK